MQDKLEIIDAVYDKIESKGIWIPYGEVEINLNKKIDKYNRNISNNDMGGVKKL